MAENKTKVSVCGVKSVNVMGNCVIIKSDNGGYVDSTTVTNVLLGLILSVLARSLEKK